MKKGTIAIVCAAVGVFLVYSFFYLDFQFSTSSTQAVSEVSTFRYNSTTPDLNVKVYLYIQPAGQLERIIRADLASMLDHRGAEVNMTESLSSKYDDQAILIAIQNRSISYNPIIPRATVRILIFYTYNGNTTYFEEFLKGETPVMAFNTPNMIIEGEINLTDSTNGVISLIAYRRHLAENLAGEAFKKLPWGET